MAEWTPWLAAALYLVSFSGIAFSVLQALRSGADAYSREYTASAARELEDMFLFIPPRRILELAMASAALCFILVFFTVGGFTRSACLRGLVIGAAAAAAGWTIPGRILKHLKSRRLRRFNEQLVDGLMNMSNALRAGFSILQSFEAIARQGLNPISQEFSVFLHQVRVGVTFEDSLHNLHARVGSDDLALVVSSIEVARQTGGNLTEVLEKIAHTIRERMRIERRIRTLTAQGKLQGWVVGAMPLILGLVLLFMQPGTMIAFAYSPVGVFLLCLVVLLEVLGALVIRKIIRIDV